MIGVEVTMHLCPFRAPTLTFQPFVNSVTRQFIVIELVLYGIGHVLCKGVKTSHPLAMHLRAIHTPSIAVVFPRQVILSVGIDATINIKSIGLGFTGNDGECSRGLGSHLHLNEQLTITCELIGLLNLVTIEHYELPATSHIEPFEHLRGNQLNNVLTIVCRRVLHLESEFLALLCNSRRTRLCAVGICLVKIANTLTSSQQPSTSAKGGLTATIYNLRWVGFLTNGLYITYAAIGLQCCL